MPRRIKCLYCNAVVDRAAYVGGEHKCVAMLARKMQQMEDLGTGAEPLPAAFPEKWAWGERMLDGERMANEQNPRRWIGDERWLLEDEE